jgi:hypothetical protein
MPMIPNPRTAAGLALMPLGRRLHFAASFVAAYKPSLFRRASLRSR